jgi:hypothetical protein
LGAGDSGRPDDSQASGAERRRGRSDGASRRHEVVDDHHRGRSRRPHLSTAGDELADRRKTALGGGEPGGVRSLGCQHQDPGDADSDATPAQDAGSVPGKPLDMLTTAATGDGPGGRDGNEQHRPVPESGDRCRERNGQRPGEVTASPLLVGEQARPRGSGVLGCHRHRGKTCGRRIRPVWPRSGDRLPAAHAHGPTSRGAAAAPAGKGQIGQDGEHATTVPPSSRSRQAGFAICGQRSGLWMAS